MNKLSFSSLILENMKSILLLPLLYTALISATCADASNEIQSSEEPSSTTGRVLVDFFTDLVSSIKKHVEEDEEFEMDFLAPHFFGLIKNMIPVFEKEFIDPMEDDVGRTIFKIAAPLLSLIIKQAEQNLGQDNLKEIRRPSNRMEQIRFLNEFNRAIMQALK